MLCRCNFPNVQFPKQQLLQVWLSPHCSQRRLREHKLTYDKLPLRKLSLGKSPLGKYRAMKSNAKFHDATIK